jgi:hypothetical protein
MSIYFGRRVENTSLPAVVVLLAGISDDFIRCTAIMIILYSQEYVTPSHLSNATFTPNSIVMLHIHTMDETRYITPGISYKSICPE